MNREPSEMIPEVQRAHKEVANKIACAFLQSFPLGAFDSNYARLRIYALVEPQLESAYKAGYLMGQMNIE